MILIDKNDPKSRHHSLNEPNALRLRANASKANSHLSDVIDWLNVEQSQRYDSIDNNPACNIYAADVCYLCNIPFPPANYHDFNSCNMKTEFTSNMFLNWLASDGLKLGWRRARNLDEVQTAVNGGSVGLIIAKSIKLSERGHVSIVVPETTNTKAIRKGGKVTYPVQSTAGRKCQNRFANLDWWNANRHNELSLWLADMPEKSIFERQIPNTVYSRIIHTFLPTQVDNLHAQLLHAQSQLNGYELEDELLEVLIAAEDRRYMFHSGYDLRGILRALFRYIWHQRREGASTIEQQLVRTLTNRRELSLKRKGLEILLARWCNDHFDKRKMATIYISNAYFGWQMNNLKQAYNRLVLHAPLSLDDACFLVALLRTPLPQHPLPEVSKRIQTRVRYLKNKMRL